MVTFLALYRGGTLERAQLIAVSTDPELVAHVAAALLAQHPAPTDEDPALDVVQGARRRALRLIHREAAVAVAPAGTPPGRRRRRPGPSGDPESAA